MSRIVELSRVAQGVDHPDTLAATDTLARLLLNEGKLVEAEKLFRGNLARAKPRPGFRA